VVLPEGPTCLRGTSLHFFLPESASKTAVRSIFTTARWRVCLFGSFGAAASFLISPLSRGRSANQFSRLPFSLSFARELITVNRLHCSITRQLEGAGEPLARAASDRARAESVFMLKIMAARVTVFGNITVERKRKRGTERKREQGRWRFSILPSAAGRRLGKIAAVN